MKYQKRQPQTVLGSRVTAEERNALYDSYYFQAKDEIFPLIETKIEC